VDNLEFANAFLSAIGAGDYDTVLSAITGDFQFHIVGSPDTFNAQEWIGRQQMLRSGFPDISWNFNIEGVEGDVVQVSSQLTGTHTQDMTFPNIGVVPATGLYVETPREVSEALLEGGKVKSITIYPEPGSGVAGLLAQIGIVPPG